MPDVALCQQATAIWRAGLAGVSPPLNSDTVRDLLGDMSAPVTIVGAGKAAASMAAAVIEALGDRVVGGVVVTKDDHDLPIDPVICLQASHPVPDFRGLEAARRIEHVVRSLGPDDQLIALWSGGGSALLADPKPDLGLEGLQAITREMLRGGIPIDAINFRRIGSSTLKGGQLGALSTAEILTLVLSDVPDDDPDLVASGPTRGVGTTVVIGRLSDAIDAAEAEAIRRGWTVRRLPRLQGEASDLGRTLARYLVNQPPRTCLIGGGEATVTVTGSGLGGRCQELALAAADVLAGHAGVALLAAGTDGTDGATDAAGALIHGATATTDDPTLAAALEDNDSNPWLMRAGALFKTGPTRTNVTDLLVALRR